MNLRRSIKKAITGVEDFSDVETTVHVIKFKDIFIEVDEMSDGNYSVGWSRSLPPIVAARDVLHATAQSLMEESR